MRVCGEGEEFFASQADVPAADRPAVSVAVKESYLAGFRSVQYTSALVAFCAAIVAFFALPSRLREHSNA